jgi:hypothetical protein
MTAEGTVKAPTCFYIGFTLQGKSRYISFIYLYLLSLSRRAALAKINLNKTENKVIYVLKSCIDKFSQEPPYCHLFFCPISPKKSESISESFQRDLLITDLLRIDLFRITNFTTLKVESFSVLPQSGCFVLPCLLLPC